MNNVVMMNGVCPSNVTKKYDEMSNEELCLAYQGGDEIALMHLCTKNNGLVRKTAYDYVKTNSDELEDAIQSGYIGLIVAARKYNASHESNSKFSTYAVNWILNYIRRDVDEVRNAIHIPVNKMSEFRRVSRQVTLYEEKKLPYTVAMLAQELNMPEKDVRFYLSIKDTHFNCRSLNEEIGEEGDTTLGDLQVASGDTPEEAVVQLIQHEALYEAIESLDERLQIALCMNYGLGQYDKAYSLGTIGDVLGVSKERARQLVNNAIKELQKPHNRQKLFEDERGISA